VRLDRARLGDDLPALDVVLFNAAQQKPDVIAGFAAVAGGGGLSNCLYSNFVRDKGWGMGSLVGAIPSAVGGKQIALSHLGKVFLLTGEVPENVLCPTDRIGECEPRIGLDNVVYQFGHGELIYSRIKDHLPDPIAWTVRYHNLDISDAEQYMDARDLKYAEQYLKPFRVFDAGFKSQYWMPEIDMARFKDLVYQYFPQPILF
jgi:hypothetical protein